MSLLQKIERLPRSILIAASVFFIAVPLLATALVVNYYSEKPKYLNDWSFSKYAAKSCPPFGKYPIRVCNATGSYAAEWTKAVNDWNKKSNAAGFGDLFKKDCSFKNDVKIVPADRSQYVTGEWCEHIRLGQKEQSHGGVARTEWKKQPNRRGTRIVVCTEKYERGIKLMATPAANYLKSLSMYGILKHEIGHLPLGSKGSLPRDNGHNRYGSLMRDRSIAVDIAPSTMEILRKKVFDVCKRKE